MSILYLTEQGSKVKKSGNRIVVVRDKDILLDLPVFQVERVLVFGYIQLTTQALALFLKNGIEISYLTMAGKLIGKSAGGMSKNVFVRLAQYKAWVDRERRAALARDFVRGKINNQLAILKRLNRRKGVNLDDLLTSIRKEGERVNKTLDIAQLMGVEGMASRMYFRGVGQFFQAIPFEGRVKRPASDPVNSLLSFGYVMLTTELSSLLEAAAFDPYIGFLHSLRYGRRALSLDLVEEFRQPVVDSFVLEQVNNREFVPSDFEDVEEGKLILTPSALKKFFIKWEAWQRTIVNNQGSKMNWRQVFNFQIEQLEHSVLYGDAYQAFTMA